MGYILKAGADQLAVTVDFIVPSRGSTKSIQNGERVFVWTDYSEPRQSDGRLVARGTIVSHRYLEDSVSLQVQLDGAPAIREVLTSSLDAHKGSPDPILGPIAEVRRNTNHRIFEIGTADAEAFLDACFPRNQR